MSKHTFQTLNSSPKHSMKLTTRKRWYTLQNVLVPCRHFSLIMIISLINDVYIVIKWGKAEWDFATKNSQQWYRIEFNDVSNVFVNRESTVGDFDKIMKWDNLKISIFSRCVWKIFTILTITLMVHGVKYIILKESIINNISFILGLRQSRMTFNSLVCVEDSTLKLLFSSFEYRKSRKICMDAYLCITFTSQNTKLNFLAMPLKSLIRP